MAHPTATLPASCNWQAPDVAAASPGSGIIYYAARHAVHCGRVHGQQQQQHGFEPLPGVICNTAKVTCVAVCAGGGGHDVVVTGDEAGGVKCWMWEGDGRDGRGQGHGIVRTPAAAIAMNNAVRSLDAAAAGGYLVACDYSGAVTGVAMRVDRGRVTLSAGAAWTPVKSIPTVIRLCPAVGGAGAGHASTAMASAPSEAIAAIGYTSGKVAVVNALRPGGGVATGNHHQEEVQGLAWMVSRGSPAESACAGTATAAAAPHTLLATSGKDQRVCLCVWQRGGAATSPSSSSSPRLEFLRTLFVPRNWVSRRSHPAYPTRFSALHVLPDIGGGGGGGPGSALSTHLLASLGASGGVLAYQLAPLLRTGTPPATLSDTRVRFHAVATLGGGAGSANAGGDVVYAVRGLPTGGGGGGRGAAAKLVLFTRSRQIIAVDAAEVFVTDTPGGAGGGASPTPGAAAAATPAGVGTIGGDGAEAEGPEGKARPAAAPVIPPGLVLQPSGHAHRTPCAGGPVYCVDAFRDAPEHIVAGCGDNTVLHAAARARGEALPGFASKVTAIAACRDAHSGHAAFAFGLADGSTGITERAAGRWATRKFKSSTKKAIYTMQYGGGLWVPCEAAVYSLAADGMIYERAADTGRALNITTKLWKVKKDVLGGSGGDVGRSVPSAFCWADIPDRRRRSSSTPSGPAAPPSARVLVVGCRNGAVDVWGVGDAAAIVAPVPDADAGAAALGSNASLPPPPTHDTVAPLTLLASVRVRGWPRGGDASAPAVTAANGTPAAAEVKINSVDVVPGCARRGGGVMVAIGAADGTVRVVWVGMRAGATKAAVATAAEGAEALPTRLAAAGDGAHIEQLHSVRSDVHAVGVACGRHHALVNSVKWCPPRGGGGRGDAGAAAAAAAAEVLASGSYDGTAQLWALPSGAGAAGVGTAAAAAAAVAGGDQPLTPLLSIRHHTARVYAVAWGIAAQQGATGGAEAAAAAAAAAAPLDTALLLHTASDDHTLRSVRVDLAALLAPVGIPAPAATTAADATAATSTAFTSPPAPSDFPAAGGGGAATAAPPAPAPVSLKRTAAAAGVGDSAAETAAKRARGAEPSAAPSGAVSGPAGSVGADVDVDPVVIAARAWYAAGGRTATAAPSPLRLDDAHQRLVDAGAAGTGAPAALRALAPWAAVPAARGVAEVVRGLPQARGPSGLDVAARLLAANDVRGVAMAPLFGVQGWRDTLAAVAATRVGMPVYSAVAHAAVGDAGAAVDTLLQHGLVAEALCVVHAAATAGDVDRRTTAPLLADILAHARKLAVPPHAPPAQQARAMDAQLFAGVVAELYRGNTQGAMEMLMTSGDGGDPSLLAARCYLAEVRWREAAAADAGGGEGAGADATTAAVAQRLAILNECRDKYAAGYYSHGGGTPAGAAAAAAAAGGGGSAGSSAPPRAPYPTPLGHEGFDATPRPHPLAFARVCLDYLTAAAGPSVHDAAGSGVGIEAAAALPHPDPPSEAGHGSGDGRKVTPEGLARALSAAGVSAGLGGGGEGDGADDVAMRPADDDDDAGGASQNTTLCLRVLRHFHGDGRRKYTDTRGGCLAALPVVTPATDAAAVRRGDAEVCVEGAAVPALGRLAAAAGLRDTAAIAACAAELCCAADPPLWAHLKAAEVPAWVAHLRSTPLDAAGDTLTAVADAVGAAATGPSPPRCAPEGIAACRRVLDGVLRGCA